MKTFLVFILSLFAVTGFGRSVVGTNQVAETGGTNIFSKTNTFSSTVVFTNHAIASFPGTIRFSTNQSGALDFTAANVLLLRLGTGGVTMFDEFRLGEGAEEKFAVDAEGNVSWAGAADGDGSLINTLNASALASGTVADARLGASVSLLGQTISEAEQVTSDVTTLNVSTTKHGYAPKGDGDTAKFLNANGAYSVPAGGGGSDNPWTADHNLAGYLATNASQILFTNGNVILGGNTSTNTINVTNTAFNTIGGGELNTIASDTEKGTISGGSGNTILINSTATIGGGQGNTTSNQSATIAGGTQNNAFGFSSTVGGGEDNTASGGYSTVSGGLANIASGLNAGILGGEQNIAGGDYSFAAGLKSKATHGGSFVWSDAADGTDFNSTIADEFAVRARGGVRFVTGGAGLNIDGPITGSLASNPNLTNVNAYASSTTVVPLQIILPSGMLTNGLEILDSAGTILWSVGSNGTQRIFGTTNSSLILYAPDGTTAQISLNNGNITNTGILSVAGAATVGGLLSAAGNAAIIGNISVGTGGAGGSWLVNGQIVLPTAGGVTIGTSANNNSPRIARAAATGLEYAASIELLGAGGARGGTNNLITSGKNWSTNGFGSFASVATNAVASTGWTNTYMVNAAVRIEGTAVLITIKNAAQTVLDTYTLTGDIEHNLQPGHAITASAGLTGTARPW